MDLSIEYEVTQKDYIALWSWAARSTQGRAGHCVLVTSFVLVILCGGLLAYFEMYHGWRSVGPFFLGIALTLAALIVYSRMQRRNYIPNEDGIILGAKRLEATDECLRQGGDGYDVVYRWHKVQAVDETADHVFIKFDNAVALTVPKRAFASPQEAQGFAADLKDAAERARSNRRP